MNEAMVIPEPPVVLKPQVSTPTEAPRPAEENLVSNQLDKMQKMNHIRQEQAEEASLAHADNIFKKTGSVSEAFWGMTGQASRADNISCCYNGSGSHAAEERFFTTQLERVDLTPDQRLVFEYVKKEAGQVRASRELVGQVIIADAMTDARIHNGTILPEDIDNGDYIYGHAESDTYVDPQVTNHAVEVMAQVEQAMPQWQKIAEQQEQIFTAFTPADVRAYEKQTNFSLQVGKQAMADTSVFERYKAALAQAQETGDTQRYKKTMQAFVVRAHLTQAHLEELHYLANTNLLRKMEEGNGILPPEQQELVRKVDRNVQSTELAA